MEPPDDDFQALLSDPEALRKVKEVDRALVPILAELHRESILVEASADADNGVTCYSFDEFGFQVRVELLPSQTSAVLLSVVIRIGRCYTGYRQALRWLANNRACNSVGIIVDDDRHREAALALSCMRITAPGDEAGLRATFADIHAELSRVDSGLKMWFPHVLRGMNLDEMEKYARSDEAFAAVLAAPQGLLEHACENPDEEPPSEMLEACCWLKKWDQYLLFSERWMPEKQDEKWKELATGRVRALMELGRYEELLNAICELKAIGTEADKPMYIGVEGQAHYCMGQFEEAIDLLRSAELDEVPRVWFFRSLANAKLGHKEASLDCYYQYERRVGLDIIGRRKFAEVDKSMNPT